KLVGAEAERSRSLFSQKPKAKSQKPKAKSQKPKAKSQKPKAKFALGIGVISFFDAQREKDKTDSATFRERPKNKLKVES
nr:hypothetical protein [Lutibacter sp.]